MENDLKKTLLKRLRITVREKIKGSGEWWLFLHLGGQRKSRKVGTEAEALARKEKIEARLVLSDDPVSELREIFNSAPRKKESHSMAAAVSRTKPFSFYCERWLTEFMPAKCKPSTQRDYKSIHKVHLKAAQFYNTPIDEISEDDIETFLIGKRKTLARSTCVHIKNALSNSFKRAVKGRAIRTNPCHGAEIPKDQGVEEKKSSAYSEAEIQQLLAAYKGHRYYHLVLFLCKTGCRFGEMCALTWDDLDLDARTAKISKGIVRSELTTTKTGKSRKVDLTPALIAELRKLRLKNKIKGKYVFQNTAGNFVDIDNFRYRTWYPMLEKNGLRRIRIHDLRHSYASLLIHKSKDLHYAQKQLGHHSITVTVDRYGHLLETDTEVRRVDILDEVGEI